MSHVNDHAHAHTHRLEVRRAIIARAPGMARHTDPISHQPTVVSK